MTLFFEFIHFLLIILKEQSFDIKELLQFPPDNLENLGNLTFGREFGTQNLKGAEGLV
jgi:hypothetical protein